MNSGKKMPSLDDDLELWLNLLADDELLPERRKELIEYLNLHPENWQACARLFLDQQTLQKTMAASPGAPTLVVTDTNVVSHDVLTDRRAESGRTVALGSSPRMREDESGRRRLNHWLTLAGCLALMGFCGYLAGLWNGFGNGRQESRLELERAAQQIAQLVRERDSESPPAVTLASLHSSLQCELVDRFQGQPMLVELENTPSRALYVTNQEIPRSLLDCFAAAGFGVEIQPYEPKFMNPFNTPVVAIEVSKRNAFHLLAIGESK